MCILSNNTLERRIIGTSLKQEMELRKGFLILILVYLVHLTTNEILYLPQWSAYDGTFYNVENQESKVVFLKTCQGGVFGFFEWMNTSSLVYEITFGSYRIRTMIWGHDKNGPVSIATDPELIPEENRFKSFYFHWANNTMVVGAGPVVGQGPRLQLSSSIAATVRYMSVRTKKCPMDYILELSCRKV
ncbi:hypothetical protein SNE40_000600 [Patella caerulea]|uniref:Farnesoic acid O-methyl transferase domain-containing protein n=1 Tax=Patella caerulea TaxID=87958 RepID=A0AAN8KLN7_PATCE